MEKYIFLVLSILSFNIYAQERSVNLNKGEYLDLNYDKDYIYVGTTLDRLIPTTRDTIDYILFVKNQTAAPLHFYATFTLDTIAGADTTVSISVDYKMFNNQTYSSLIGAANTSAVTAELLVNKTTLGVISESTTTVASHTNVGTAFTIKQDTATFKYYPADSLKVPAITFTEGAQTITKVANAALYYKIIRFRLILNGNDSVGTGIKVKRFEINFNN